MQCSLLGLAVVSSEKHSKLLWQHSRLPILRVRSILGGPAMSESVVSLHQRSCDEISGIDAE